VRKGHHGPLHHAAGRNPKAALTAIDALHLCDGDRVWVWRAASVRSDIENSSVGALGPVGDPRVFEVRIGLIELNEGFSDPEVILKEMLEESETLDAPRYPKAPHIISCTYDADRDVFLVSFDGRDTEVFPGSYVKRVDGTPVSPGAVRRCIVDRLERSVRVELEDGSSTSFSADLVLYETDPSFREAVDRVSKLGHSGKKVVHILGAAGHALCGFYERLTTDDWPDGHKWVLWTRAAESLATCPECRAETKPKVTLSWRTAAQAEPHFRSQADAASKAPEQDGLLARSFDVLSRSGVKAASSVCVRATATDARMPECAWVASGGRVFAFYADAPDAEYDSVADAEADHPNTSWEVKALTAPLTSLPRRSHRRGGCGRDSGTDSDEPPQTPVVHVLIGNRPLCAFTDSAPPDWPSGHIWCPPGEGAARCNCPACLAAGIGRMSRPEVTLSDQLDTSEDEIDENNMGRGSRIERAIRAAMDMSDTQLRALMRVTVGAIWDAVEDLDGITEALHPADVVQKHLQRGNIRKDGQW
jgi:hypothetical protein